VNKKLLASCVVNGRFTPQYWKKFIDYREDGELNDVALVSKVFTIKTHCTFKVTIPVRNF